MRLRKIVRADKRSHEAVYAMDLVNGLYMMAKEREDFFVFATQSFSFL